MAAIGFGLPKDAFTSLMKQVHHFPALQINGTSFSCLTLDRTKIQIFDMGNQKAKEDIGTP